MSDIVMVSTVAHNDLELTSFGDTRRWPEEVFGLVPKLR